MYKLFSAISIFLLLLSTTTLNVEAQLKGKYPPVDTPPPPVAAWTALVDQSKLPKAPVRPIGTPCAPTDEFCVWSCTTCVRDTDFDFCPKKGDWALTYDDGPTNNTLRVLKALNDRGLKATFFVIGSRVFENPQILKQIVDSGHQIGVHTWSHTALTSQTTEEIIAETKWTEMAIKEAVNLTPKWFRAPQGDADDRVRGILSQLGYKMAFWNHDTFDWESNSDQTYDLNWITGNFSMWVQNKTATTGFASLEHDAFDKSSSKAEAAMDIVVNAKFAPQSAAVCSGDKQPYVETGSYAKLMVPCLFAYGLLQCLNRFLQTQNIVFPMMFSSAMTTLLHLPICWFMVYKSGLGSRGAAIANSISYWINVTILALYVKFSPSCKKTWTGFSKEAFALNNIPIFLKLAVPSAVMVCLEMWSFELMVLLSGLLPNPKLETSVLSISLNTSALVWMIPFGLSGAISIRVSNELGAGNPRAARLAVYVVVVIAIIESIVVGAVIILIRNIWGYAYSNEEEVVKYVAIMLPIIAVSNFLDGIQSVLSGTARGVGWQKIGAYVNLGSYYLVGIPAAVVLAFVLHVGGKGLWLGIICALFVQVVSLTIITIRTDWEKEAKKATDRVYDSITTESLVS